MDKLVRKIDFRNVPHELLPELLQREWLVTNGLGGYSSGTISGSVSWRYHGLLVAALPEPFGRMVMLNHLGEHIRLPGGTLIALGEHKQPSTEKVSHSIKEFRLENHLPVWRYEVEDIIIEKYVLFLYGQNTIHVCYQLLSDQDHVQLELRPSIHFRGHGHAVNEGSQEHYRWSAVGERYEVTCGDMVPQLRLALKGDHPAFTYDGGSRREIIYPKESDRGYPSRGSLWSPGYFTVQLHPRREATLIASTEWWSTMLALSPAEALGFYHDRHRRLVSTAQPEARVHPATDLVLAADQFIIKPAGRVQDAARAHAAGDDIRTVIAGYHWFTDWGRDTMISLEGLTLATGRYAEAAWILRTFAYYIRDGLIPNLFPEGESQGLYHTADATLWFFHALDRYVTLTGDRITLRLILPKLVEIARKHEHGTRFGIHVDPSDGLLCQGAEGYQLTWMDAKVEDWVVTPRRGKAVEINGLWYNALKLLEHWLREEHQEKEAELLAAQAGKARDSFNQRFWYERDKHLYDVVDGESGDDCACRPNQLLAFSLKHPILEEKHWKPVLETVQQRLLTAVGLRSLSPGHPDYKPKYFGDLRARDAAYHQGTVWAWFIGPFIDAWLKVHPGDPAQARKFLDGFEPHLSEGCIGSISEIFDAEPPFTPRGCIGQAWSVAEVLRCWVKTGGKLQTSNSKLQRNSKNQAQSSNKASKSKTQV